MLGNWPIRLGTIDLYSQSAMTLLTRGEVEERVYLLLVVRSTELALNVVLLWAAAKLTTSEVKRKEKDSMLIRWRCCYQTGLKELILIKGIHEGLIEMIDGLRMIYRGDSSSSSRSSRSSRIIAKGEENNKQYCSGGGRFETLKCLGDNHQNKCAND